MRKQLAELEPTRRYQPSSTDGAGVRSAGPYYWRTPREYYKITDDYFKTETGSVSVPTLESIHGMMPKKDWETINDDWAEHDLARGAQQGTSIPNCGGPLWQNRQPRRLCSQGAVDEFRGLPRHVRGPQRALFHPPTGVITWMSDPAQPSFVWQIYHYDLEPTPRCLRSGLRAKWSTSNSTSRTGNFR